MKDRNPDVPKQEQGLFRKYRVERVDGKPTGPCFVLEFKDKFAGAALMAYADACESEYPDLAKDLRDRVNYGPRHG